MCFFECLNVYFFSETAFHFRFRLLIHKQIKDEISNKNSVLRIPEADSIPIESVTGLIVFETFELLPR